ncbi:MAG: hypothetical protein ABH840_01155 [Nanoarchaeota archaeon]
MFSKKCPKCARKVQKDFDFCPFCGMDFRINKRMRQEEDYGFLGKEDAFESRVPNRNIGLPFGFNNLFNSLLKEVDSQFRELDKEMAKPNQKKKEGNFNESGISINISSATGKKPEIKINAFGPEFSNLKLEQAKEIKPENPNISEEQARKISKLPKKEAETSVRRLSNKIIYEINLPGIKNLKDILINKLENSTEIRAFTKDTAYFKILPVNLPITHYLLKAGKLIIEFSPQ